MLINKIIDRIVIYNKLINLGFFVVKKSQLTRWNYKNFVNYKSSISYFLNYKYVQKVIKSLQPLIKNMLINKSVFLFLTLNEHCDVFYESFYEIMSRLKVYLIFDWGFGILTNRVRIYLNYNLNSTYCFEEFPDLVFLSGIFGRQKVVITELKTKCILTSGIIDQSKLVLLDYSLPGKISIEYLYYFFKLILVLLEKEYKRYRLY